LPRRFRRSERQAGRVAPVDRYAGGLPAALSSAASGLSTTSRCSGAKTKRSRSSEKLLALSNDLGLLAEEYDPTERRLPGNFPQALSHVGLLNSALNLSKTTNLIPNSRG
jgi:hypothetical protein